MDCQKNLFLLPNGHHYINCSYLSPLLKSVEEAGMAGIRAKRTPWQTKPDDFFTDSNKLRRLFADVINAGEAEGIAIIPSVSYAMSTIAKNLPEKTSKNIILAGEQFPSNVYPWKKYSEHSGCGIQSVSSPEEFENRGKIWNDRILDAINKETLMVAIGNIHWTDGTLFDLKAIRERTDEVDAYLVIDGTQSIGALPFDVRKVQPDALICAGYKWLMGPYSMALAYYSERMRNGIPLEESWINRKNSEDFTSLVNYADEYHPGAVRFDVGERSNFILVPMMVKALEQILQWGSHNIQSYCHELTESLTKELPEYGYRIEKPDFRAHHMFGLQLPDHASIDKLQYNLAQNNIYVSVRGSAVRISPNVYNNEEDMTALREVLINI